jgi:hypothetical protein
MSPGEELVAVLDGIYGLAGAEMEREPVIRRALASGELTPQAAAAIGLAIDRAFARALRTQQSLIGDLDARRVITGYMFGRAFAAVQASATYSRALAAAFSTTRLRGAT